MFYPPLTSTDNAKKLRAKMTLKTSIRPLRRTQGQRSLCLWFVACWLATATPLVQGHLYFLPFLHPPRVYEGAPAGTYVMAVVARDDDGSRHITYGLLEDEDMFQVENTTGQLSTRHRVLRQAGEVYKMLLVAVSADETQTVPLTVEVTHANRQAPQFGQPAYATQVSSLMPVNSTVLTVAAIDPDPEVDNAEVFYFLAKQSEDLGGSLTAVTASGLSFEGAVDWDPGASGTGFFSIDQRSGAVVLRRALPRKTGSLHALVVATDGGSPRRKNTTWIEVEVKTIEAPRNLTVDNATATNVRACWLRPLAGAPVAGYLLWYGRVNGSGPGSKLTLNVTVEDPEPLQRCIYLNSLRPGTGYQVSVAGWNEEETGIKSEVVRFNTSIPRCFSENLCGNGTCNPLPGPGSLYRCSCHVGFYGSQCEHYNPCVSSPCQNLGTCINTSHSQYECACRTGFSGRDCTDFDPCANRLAINCQNGGTCFSNGSHAFKCICPQGYFGPMCQWYDPCSATPPPCHNGAACRNDSRDSNEATYTCLCRPGFEGAHCEEDINECLPSPCFNGATCRDGPHSFTCLCAPGFMGAFCQEDVDECESSPCAHGGRCQDQLNGFECHCPPGYQGKHCDVDVDECASSPCQNGGTCRQLIADYTCLCPFQFQGPTCEEPVRCPSETLKVLDQDVRFQDTDLDTSAIVPCPYGPENATVVRTCTLKDHKVAWGPADQSPCQERSLYMAKLMTNKLHDMTSNPIMLVPDDIRNITGEIENILEHAIRNPNLACDMLAVISNMMDANDTAFESEEVNASSHRLSHVISRFVHEVEVTNELKIQTDNLMIQVLMANVTGVSGSNNSRSGLRLRGLPPRTQMPYTGNATLDEEAPELTVSSDVLHLAATGTKSRPRVHFVAHSNAKFFREASNTSALDRLTTSGRPVFVVNLANTTVANISGGVSFTMRKPLQGRWICAFWDRSEDGTGRWSKVGLSSLQDDENVTCTSNHMTAFSILLDPEPDVPMDDLTSKRLSIISYVGSGLSIIGLLLTILTYSLFRSLNRDRHGKILLNLCTAMLFLNVSFLVGAFRSDQTVDDVAQNADFNGSLVNQSMGDLTAIRNDGFCTAIAVLSHYFLLTTFFWMSVEAANMYQLLVYVFNTAETHFLLKRCLVAWGVPLIIVGITAIVDIGAYNYDNQTCLLSVKSPYVYYITLFGPCCLLLLTNTVVFGLVTRILLKPRQTVRLEEKGDRKSSFDTVTFAQVRGAFTVMVLLGVAWVFGALAVGPVRILFQYLFCVFNSLQGFLLFVVRCLQYPEARAAWLQLFRTGTLKKYRGSKVATSSNSHTKPSGGVHSGAGSSSAYSNHTHSTFDGNGNGMHPITGTVFTRNVPGVTASGGLAWSKTSGIQSPAWVYGGTTEKLDKPVTTPHEDSKEGRDTCWEYHDINRPDPIETRGPWVPDTSPMRLSAVGGHDLPYIEDEAEPATQGDREEEEADISVEIRVKRRNRANKVPLSKTESHSDQGYATGEHSPTKRKNRSAPTSPTETFEFRTISVASDSHSDPGDRLAEASKY